MNLTLERSEYGENGVFGRLGPLYTLEHAYSIESAHGKIWQAKVPLGVYKCVRGKHRTKHIGEFETFEVTNVPGHTGILFHVGGTEVDSEGCILLGLARHGMSMIYSSDAFRRFMQSQLGVNEFTLTVKDRDTMAESVVVPAAVDVPAAPPAAAAPSIVPGVHNKVAIPTFAGMLVGTVLLIAKQKWGLDLSGQEVVITQLITGLIGWLVPQGGS